MPHKILHLGSDPYRNQAGNPEKKIWRSPGDSVHIFTNRGKPRLFGSDFLVKTRVLSDLLQKHVSMNPELAKEIYGGAHVIVQGDGGKLYTIVSNHPNLAPYVRGSSHESSSPQLGVILEPGYGTLLVGIHKETGHTWFQFEGAAVGLHVSLRENIRHFVDYIKYRLTKRNQGPVGSSEHTDKNPLLLKFRG